MSHENVEAVKRLFAAFNAGRLDALIEASHPKGEVIPLRAALNGTSVRDGRVLIARTYTNPAEALEAVGLSEWAMSQQNVDSVRAVLRAWNGVLRRPRAISDTQS